MDLMYAGSVPVVRNDGPGPFSAALVFRAGVRFATFRTIAAPHLVEHLVMAGIPRNHLDINATVDDHMMTFYATGERDEVLQFMSAVVGQIREPDMSRLAHEAGIITLEGGMAVSPPVGRAAVSRYGFVGVGLAGVDGPGPNQISADQASEFMARHLVAENAALAITGALPPDFVLDLPSGERPVMPVPATINFSSPSLVRTDCDQVTLSFLLPVGDPAADLVGFLLSTAAEEELRHRRGLVYEVFADRVLVTPELSLGVLGCSGAPENLAAISECLVAELRRMARVGPDAGELATAKRAAMNRIDDPRIALESAEAEVRILLESGRAPRCPAELRTELELVDAADVRRVLTHSLDQIALEVPSDTDFGIEGLRDCTEDQWDAGPDVTGEVFRRRLISLAPLGTKACVGKAGISLTLAGNRVGVAWADVVGVGQDGADRVIAGSDGRTLPVFRGWYSDADRLVALIDEYGADVLFEAPAEEAAHGH